MVIEREKFNEMSQKSFGVSIEEKLADEFTEWLAKHGVVKYRAIEGALRAFMVLPPELRNKLITNDVTDVYSLLVEGLVDQEIQKHLEKLGPAKNEFLRLLKQAIKKTSQK